MSDFPKIEVAPILKGFTCKAYWYAIYALVTFMPLVIGIFIWYFYNIWIAIAFFLFLTLASGVVVSKLRINSIPFEQRELNYSTFVVIRWFVGRNLCLD